MKFNLVEVLNNQPALFKWIFSKTIKQKSSLNEDFFRNFYAFLGERFLSNLQDKHIEFTKKELEGSEFASGFLSFCLDKLNENDEVVKEYDFGLLSFLSITSHTCFTQDHILDLFEKIEQVCKNYSQHSKDSAEYTIRKSLKSLGNKAWITIFKAISFYKDIIPQNRLDYVINTVFDETKSRLTFSNIDGPNGIIHKVFSDDHLNSGQIAESFHKAFLYNFFKRMKNNRNYSFSHILKNEQDTTIKKHYEWCIKNASSIIFAHDKIENSENLHELEFNNSIKKYSRILLNNSISENDFINIIRNELDDPVFILYWPFMVQKLGQRAAADLMKKTFKNFHSFLLLIKSSSIESIESSDYKQYIQELFETAPDIEKDLSLIKIEMSLDNTYLEDFNFYLKDIVDNLYVFPIEKKWRYKNTSFNSSDFLSILNQLIKNIEKNKEINFDSLYDEHIIPVLQSTSDYDKLIAFSIHPRLHREYSPFYLNAQILTSIARTDFLNKINDQRLQFYATTIPFLLWVGYYGINSIESFSKILKKCYSTFDKKDAIQIAIKFLYSYSQNYTATKYRSSSESYFSTIKPSKDSSVQITLEFLLECIKEQPWIAATVNMSILLLAEEYIETHGKISDTMYELLKYAIMATLINDEYGYSNFFETLKETSITSILDLEKTKTIVKDCKSIIDNFTEQSQFDVFYVEREYYDI